MTFRSVLIGLLLGMGIAVTSYFSDFVLRQPLMTSSLVPISVFGPLVLGLLLLNPLLRLGRWQLRGAEWCVIVSLMLAASVIPGRG